MKTGVGIHIYDVDELRGNLTRAKVVPINNPSDLIVSHSGKYLYSIADEGSGKPLPHPAGRRFDSD